MTDARMPTPELLAFVGTLVRARQRKDHEHHTPGELWVRLSYEDHDAIAAAMKADARFTATTVTGQRVLMGRLVDGTPIPPITGARDIAPGEHEVVFAPVGPRR